MHRHWCTPAVLTHVPGQHQSHFLVNFITMPLRSCASLHFYDFWLSYFIAAQNQCVYPDLRRRRLHRCRRRMMANGHLCQNKSDDVVTHFNILLFGFISFHLSD